MSMVEDATPVWKSACVVSVRQALVGAAVSEKFCVVVPPSVTTIDEAEAEENPGLLAIIVETVGSEAARRAGEACDPVTDVRGTAEYKRHLASELTSRTLRTAAQRVRNAAEGI